MTAKNLVIITGMALLLVSTCVTAQWNVSLPQAAPSPTGQQGGLAGTLEAVVGDPQPGSNQAAQYRFYLRKDNGDSHRLSFVPGLMGKRDEMFRWAGERVSIGVVITDRVPGTEQPGQDLLVSTIELIPASSRGGKKTIQQSIQNVQTGSKPWLSIFCKFADISSEPQRESFYENMYDNNPGGLDHYWRENSYEIMNIAGSNSSAQWVDLPGTLESYMTETTEIGGQTSPSPDLSVLLDDCTNAADPVVDFSNGGNGYYGINMMFNEAMGCCAWGGGRTKTLDGVTKNWGVTWLPPWSHKHSIIAHEMGHAFGLPHSNNWDDDDYPYDNPWDVMSMSGSTNSVFLPVYGQLGPHTNAYHKHDLGWISGDRLLVVSPETTVTTTIDAMTVPNTTNHRMAIIEINDNTYFTVEARKRQGDYDQTLPDDAVIIYEVIKGRGEPSWAVDSDVPPADVGKNEGTMWRVGETFTNSTGDIDITVEAETTNGFQVKIENRGIKTAETEVTALTEFYNSTGGANWTNNSNWLVGDPCGNAWHGVECGIGTVHNLELDGNNLIGPLPQSLGSLENLQRLSLASNQLSGAIPATLGELEKLTFLDLSNNQLSDALPASLTGLLKLTWLDLGTNQLTGPVPDKLSNLVDLYALLLGGNQLTGSIPESLGGLTELRYLHLHANQVTGSIPASLGNLAKLINLVLYSNSLTGQIPVSLGDLAKVRFLYLHDNQLNGAIPPELGNMESMYALSLGNNPLGGSLPAELGNLADLEHLYLYQNQLEGPIPETFGNLAILKTLILANNQLMGSIPVSFGNLGMLQTLNLFDNRLSGAIPAEMGNMSALQELILESNQLSGAIPATFLNLTNLFDAIGLYLGWNALYTDDQALEGFLELKTGTLGWNSTTQTTAPRRIHITGSSADSVTLEWDPITYTAQDGGYRVWYRPSGAEAFMDGGFTADKSTASHTVSGLVPGESYTFQITTETNPHSNNSNLVVSNPSLDLRIRPTDDVFQLNVGLNDAWYYPVTNGQGFFITVFPDLGIVSLSWFTYDNERPAEGATAQLGEPGHRWLNAVGTYSGNQAVLDISYAAGGLFDTPAEVNEIHDGTIILTFNGCENGTVEYDVPSADLQGVVPLRRVVSDNIALCETLSGQAQSSQAGTAQGAKQGGGFSVEKTPAAEAISLVNMNVGLNDAWYYPATDGQGFFITVFPDISYVLLSWFTYDTQRPGEDATAILGEAGHRWFNALGAISGNSATLDISIASGGLFDSPQGVSESLDGVITLTFETCETGTVEYDIPSIDRKGTVPIQRVAADNIALCESLVSE